MERLIKGYSRTQLTEYVEEWIVGRNALRNREIIKRKLIDGVSYEALAEEFDLSLRRTKRIVAEGVDIIRAHI